MSGLKIKDKYTVLSSKDLKCGCCGNCCRFYENINLHITDIFRLAEHLKISPQEFFNKYCRIVGDNEENCTFTLNMEGGCKFLVGNRCVAHEARTDTCALYPFDFPCINLSQNMKRDMHEHPTCFIHALDDDLLIVPDLERMVDNRIMSIQKEMYISIFGCEFNEESAKAFHASGIAQAKNPRMREMIHKQLLYDFIQNVPKDDNGQPLLTPEEVMQIYGYIKN